MAYHTGYMFLSTVYHKHAYSLIQAGGRGGGRGAVFFWHGSSSHNDDEVSSCRAPINCTSIHRKDHLLSGVHVDRILSS